MTHCTRCGRRLKAPTPTGLGPVCAAKAATRCEATADLWFDTEVLAQRARERLARHIDIETTAAQAQTMYDFAQARERCGL